MYVHISLLPALLLIALAAGNTANATPAEPSPPLVVLHKTPQLSTSDQTTFEAEVLTLALDKTVAELGPYTLQGISLANPSRTLVMLHEDIHPNLILQMSYEDDIAKRENLIYIPFPIYRGAASYRICFMRDELKDLTKHLTHKDQLKPYHFGVGIGWVEAKVFRHNKLKPVEGSNIVSLFRMTKAGRVDFFCRSVMEYVSELQHPSSLGITSDSHLALYYPLPKFFFAHKNSKTTLDRIQKGLDIAFKDGSFDALWRSRHLEAFKQSRLNERNLIRLENPYIKHLPKDYEAYLYDPINR